MYIKSNEYDVDKGEDIKGRTDNNKAGKWTAKNMSKQKKITKQK